MSKITQTKTELGRYEKKQLFVTLRAKGMSYMGIAQQLHVSKSTLIAWNAEMKNDIAIDKAIELEHLQEKYHLLREKRIETLGEKVKIFEAELATRDLSDIDSARLLELFLRYHTELSKEYVEADPFSEYEKNSPEELIRREYGSGKNGEMSLELFDALTKMQLRLIKSGNQSDDKSRL